MVTDYPSDEGVPPRVLAAEKRRKFRQLMENSSLFCQNCYHNKGQHDILSAPSTTNIKFGRCLVAMCDCTGATEDTPAVRAADAEVVERIVQEAREGSL